MPAEWVTRRISYDYGLDLNVELAENGSLTGKNFSIQVKATQKRRPEANFVSVRLAMSTLSYMRKRPEPVLIMVYVNEDKEAYWVWAKEIARPDTHRTTVIVRVPTSRRLTKTDWAEFSRELRRYFYARPLVDARTAESLERFGRYSIDLGRRSLLLKEDVDKLERLIEQRDCSEQEVQMFIEQHPGIFVGGEYVRMHAQVRLRGPDGLLIPDFLLEHVSGLCDIMELKLPQVTMVAGPTTRRRYSASVFQAAAQTRVYRDFFDDSIRRDWFEHKYKLRAYKPRTILLIGRDIAFRDSLQKRELEAALHDYRVLTYDDLVRIGRAQQVD